MLIMFFVVTLVFGQSVTVSAINWDEFIEVDAPVEDVSAAQLIGPQVFQSSALTAATGSDAKGHAYMYFIMHGTPTALAVADLQTNEVVGVHKLEHSTSAWGIDVDDEGIVWIGGTTSGHIYSYNPNTKEFVDHGNKLENPKDTAIQDIYVNEGIVYGTTAYGGTAFSYNPTTEELLNYGQVAYKKEYAKTVAHDADTNALFVGVGSKADLIKLDLKTKQKKSFLPNEYANEKYISDLQIIGDHLLARTDPGKQLLIFDKHTLELKNVIDVHSRTISKKSPSEEAFYYTKDNTLFKYDLTEEREEDLGVSLLKGTEMLNLGFVNLHKHSNDQLNDDASEPINDERLSDIEVIGDVEAKEVIGSEAGNENGEDKKQQSEEGLSLVGLLDNDGNVFKYHLDTGESEVIKFSLPPQPVTLYTMIQDEKRENIFINGYMSGGLAIYNPEKDKTTLYKDISQIESMTIFNNKLYVGAYPRARVLELDLTKPWGPNNPRQLMKLSDFGQERSTAVAAVPELKKVFVGTYPETSIGGGALAIYDTQTNEYKVHENYIYNQSLISFLYHDEYMYGGTSIHANHNVNPRGARLFRFSPEFPESKEYIHLPVEASMITSLRVDNNGVIWGMADGTLFSYNPETKEIKTKQILELISGRFRNASILVGIDGNIYGTVEGKLFKADPQTLDFDILLEEGANEIAQDKEGMLYFRNQAELWKYDLTKHK